MLHSIARYCFRHARLIITFWIVMFIAFMVISATVKPTWLQQGRLEGAESTKALDVLKESLPDQVDQANERTGRIVFKADDEISSHKSEIEAYLDKIVKDKKDTKVVSTSSPFESANAGQISKDGNVAFASVTFESKPSLNGLGQKTVDESSKLRKSIDVEFSGYMFAPFDFPKSELFGILAAVIILLIVFGSLVAAGLPIFTAVLGIVIGGALTTLWSHIIGVPDFTTQVGAMIGLGVGIDYALFIVTRFREALKKGHTAEDAAMEAMTTAGAAVLFAGITVVISLLGMIVINLDFVTGIAVGTSTTVLLVLLVTLTLIPALMGSVIGRNLDKLSLPHRKTVPDKPAVWVRWSEFIQRRAWFSAILGVIILLLLAFPILSLRVGTSDDGNAPDAATTRKSYDILAESFGPGFNGPLFMVVDMRDANAKADLTKLVKGIEGTEGVAAVYPSSEMLKQQALAASITFADGAKITTTGKVTPQQQAAMDALMQNPDAKEKNGAKVVPVQVFPTTSPQDEKTTQLVHHLRDETVPSLVKGTGAQAYISGMTAGNIDFADVMASRTPIFIGAVLILSFLLLMSVFRSVLVALKAVIMNLLSIGAAYGVIVAVFQWGWLRQLIGVGAPGPIEPWAPMMLFAIVFGLSMDYEVFLLSKIKEEYDDTKDNAGAVTHGLASTARVITAAALIMIFVFGSFILNPGRPLKLMGLGLSAAVFIDATFVRMLLVPATMELLGDKNWWIPKWLDRIIPKIHVERVQADTPAAIAEGVEK